MNKIISIIKDELNIFLHHQGALLVMIVGLFAYSFCYALPYYYEVIKNVPVGVMDMDDTKLSKKLIRNIHATDTILITQELQSMNEAQREFYKGNLKGFIVIPKNFEQAIMRGEQTNVTLYADSAYLIVYKAIYSEMLETTMEMGAQIEVAKMMKAGLTKKQALSIKKTFDYIEIPLFNASGGYKSYVYPVILVLILHQTLFIGIALIQATRNEKKQLYCKDKKDVPLNLFFRSSVYVSLYLVYGLVKFLIYPAILNYPIHYNVGSLLLMYILMIYAVAFLAHTIAYFCKMREDVMMMLVPASIIFMFIPGLVWPRESIPAIINMFSFLIPSTCGIDGIIKINQNGATFMNVLYDYLWLAALCILYFSTSCMLIKKQYKKFSDVKEE